MEEAKIDTVNNDVIPTLGETLKADAPRKIDFTLSRDPYMFFLFGDAEIVWNKYFPTYPIDASMTINALTRMRSVVPISISYIVLEFREFRPYCWDLISLIISITYQLIMGQGKIPVLNPLSNFPINIPSLAIIALAYTALYENKENRGAIIKSLNDNLALFDPNTGVVIAENIKYYITDYGPQKFFSKYLCTMIGQVAFQPSCQLRVFLVPSLYNQNLTEQIKAFDKSWDDRSGLLVTWNVLTSLGMDQYWNMKKKFPGDILENITQLMAWLGGNILSDMLCLGQLDYNKTTQHFELTSLKTNSLPSQKGKFDSSILNALHGCTLSLIMTYIGNTLDTVFQAKNNADPDFASCVGLAALILAYKALGLDDTKGCLETLPLHDMVAKIVKPEEFKNDELVIQKRIQTLTQNMKEVEIEMYALVNYTPCKEQFEQYIQILPAKNVALPQMVRTIQTRQTIQDAQLPQV